MIRELKMKIRAKKDIWDSLTPMQQLAFLDEIERELGDIEDQLMMDDSNE